MSMHSSRAETVGTVPPSMAAERIHHDCAGPCRVGAVLARDVLDEADRAIRFDPPGRDAHDAHALGADFLGEAFAVVRQRVAL